MYKLCFFVPDTHVEKVKNALFIKGAGRIGQYDHCSWQVLGVGQFKPLKGSDPFLGIQDKIECVAEYKVEMVCEEHLMSAVIIELIEKHPYEEPAYEIYPILTGEDF